MNILQAIDDPHLFAPWFRDPASWRPWRVFLAGLFALPFADGADEELFEQCTDRVALPPAQRPAANQAFVCVGRRGGKSFVMALLATYCAAFRTYTQYLQPGERATVMLIAADKRQARVLLRYIRGFFTHVPMLRKMLVNETAEGIELNNSVSIEIVAASFRGVRGYTCAAILCDEICYWMNDESSSNPDSEILAALEPSLLTIPGAMLIAASSPHAKRGVMWEAFRKHWGKSGGPLVWRAPTTVMHPTVRRSIIDEALEKDPEKARSEYLAEWRSDIAAYVPREVVESCVDPQELERPRNSATTYTAFCDPSGGSSDSFTLAIAHRDKKADMIVVDVVREVPAPFAPESVVEEFATLLKSYGLNRVIGDRYAGQWPVEQFRKRNIRYEPSEWPKSALYGDLLPKLNSRTIRLLDNPRLINQLAALERRTARGGKDSIDHPPSGRDDVANAVAGVAAHVQGGPRTSITR